MILLFFIIFAEFILDLFFVLCCVEFWGKDAFMVVLVFELLENVTVFVELSVGGVFVEGLAIDY